MGESEIIQDSASQSVMPGPAGSTLPGNLLEMQISCSTLDLSISL